MNTLLISHELLVLALALGLTPADRGPKHAAAVKRVVDSCRSHGVAAGIVLGDGRTAKAHLDLGFQFINPRCPGFVLQAFLPARRPDGIARLGGICRSD